MATLTRKQLDGLTKEQKLQLLDALEEKKRRKRELRQAYVPNSGQLLMHQSKKKIRFNLSGNGAGKTTSLIQEAMWAADGYNPVLDTYTKVPANVVVVLDSPLKVRDVYLGRNGIKKWFNVREDQMHKDGKPQISRISRDNGSQITFMSQDQDLTVFEGIEVDVVIFDEPAPRAIFIALLRGGRTKGYEPKFILAGTMVGYNAAWVREMHREWEQGEHPDVEFFKTSSHVNAHNLLEGYIDSFSGKLTERERESRIEGGFFDASGLALADLFNRKIHVVAAASLPPTWPTWFGTIAIDPHPSKDLHAILLLAGQTPEGKRQLVYAQEFKRKMLPRDFAKWLKQNWLSTHNIVDIVCDNFGSGEYTGGEGFASFIEVLNREGVRVRPTSYDEKKDGEFLTRLQEALYVPAISNEKDGAAYGARPLLQILEGNMGIVHDCENVAWKPIKGTEDFQQKLEIGNRDFLACLKYALATNPTGNASRGHIHRPPGRKAPQQQAAAKNKPKGAFEQRWEAEASTKARLKAWKDF